MRKLNPALFALCAILLWLGTAQAARYVDNGDGTVTDTVTRLMWEKKTTDGSIHDINNFYSWSKTGTTKPDGTAFVVFLGTLNHNSSDPNNGNTLILCFANHCDWRLPTVAELNEIFDRNAPGCGFGGNCIDPALGPTHYQPYWSSTTKRFDSFFAWDVAFPGIVPDGRIEPDSHGFEKNLSAHVRAVRGGF